MPVLRTTLATDFPEATPRSVTILKKLLFFIPEANPGYESDLHLVKEWWVEFDSEGRPDREIGLSGNGSPILAGPDEHNYGFWHDTGLLMNDFEGTEVPVERFEKVWAEYFRGRV